MNLRMPRMGRFVIALLSMGMLAGTAAAGEDVRSAIEAANQRWVATAARSDGPGVAAFYTADAQLLPPGSDLVNGTQAIGEFWQAVFDSGATGVSLVTLEVERHGDTATEVGSLELRTADGKVLDRGKYIVLWKKDGGAWKLHRDIWNTSVAPAAP